MRWLLILLVLSGCGKDIQHLKDVTPTVWRCEFTTKFDNISIGSFIYDFRVNPGESIDAIILSELGNHTIVDYKYTCYQLFGI